MYSNNFVVSILVDGTPQKELADGSVVLPFGTEYVIRLRNKHRHSRALAHVTIDGECVSGGGIVVEANDKVDLERSVLDEWKFKFVSLDSSEAVDYGKNGPNTDRSKGVIEVGWRLEEKPPYQWSTQWQNYSHPKYDYIAHQNTPTNSKTLKNPSTFTSGWNSIVTDASGFGANYDSQCIGEITYNAASTSSPIAQDMAPVFDAAATQDGCTVPGSLSDQEFVTTSFHASKDKTTIRVILRGVSSSTAHSSVHTYYETPLEKFKDTLKNLPDNKSLQGKNLKDKNLQEKNFKDNKSLEEKIQAMQQETLELELQILEVKKGKLMQELANLKA